jgi:hypothetical protein
MPTVYRAGNQHTGIPNSWQQYGLTYSNGTAPLTIGCGWPGNGDYFAGRIAEVRVSSVTRTDAWRQASYNAEGDMILMYNTPQPVPTPPPAPLPVTVRVNGKVVTTAQPGGTVDINYDQPTMTWNTPTVQVS